MAGKWLDLVVGVDVHLELVPGSPAPVPFPHPFVAPIYDPTAMMMAEVRASCSAAVGSGPGPGSIRIAGVPAAMTGDPVTMPIPHVFIPPGVVWGAIPPGSDAELIFGALPVSTLGARPVRAGEVAMSCSDPVRLPTATVISTGMSRPLMIGGSPTVDTGQARASGSAIPPRTTWSDAPAADEALPEIFGRARDVAHKRDCFVTGHPINATNGCVLTDGVDFELDGPLPIRFERNYNSNWIGREGALGPGWSHTFEQKLWVEPHCVAMQTADGREIEFSTRHLPGGVMRSGQSIRHPVERSTLRCTGTSAWTVTEHDGTTLEFVPIPGGPDQERKPGVARLVRIRGADGHEVQLHYDAQACMSELVDAVGRVVTFESDVRGRLVAVSLPAPTGEGSRTQCG